jgi:hypothetical protein
MGKLRPIGSEKLEGMDKIRRMIEISQYNLITPKPINEVSSNEYRKTLADGNTYHIVKERTGYVIKKGLYESTAEYIEPIKNRKFYPSYSQALKRLNLITKEVNINEGQTKNLSLFVESDEQMEYYLEMDEQAPPTAPPPMPAPAPAPAPTDMPPAPEGDMPPAPEGDVPPMPEEPMPEPEEPMDMGDDDDEDVTFKTIQKVTGRLAQKIRTFLSNEDNEMTSQDTKYVINSVLSALDLSTLEDDDMDEIMAKFEGGEEEGEEMPEMGGEEGGIEGEETPPPPMPDESMTPPPPALGGEMAEYRTHGARKNRHQSIEEVFEDVFSESKVDKVLGKYFGKPNKRSTDNTISKIQNLSESFKQEVQSVKFIKDNDTFKLLGKTKQGYLVFENDYGRVKITPKGNIL